MAYIDLHRHVEGSITPFVVRRIGKPLQSRWNGQVNFFASWGPIVDYLSSAEMFEQVIYYSLEELSHKNVIYVEYSFSPAESSIDSLRLSHALYQGLKNGQRDFGVQSSLIYNLTRHLPEKIADDLECASGLYDERIICGLGLAGDEVNFPLRAISKYIEPHLREDLPKSFHAGEFSDSNEIEYALALGANRIGHGIKMVQNADLMTRIQERRIGVEICMTSELALGNVDSLRSHPVFDFAERDILFNLNTDDPAVFGTEIDREYDLVASRISKDRITRNAIAMAFADESLKNELQSSLSSDTHL